MARRTRSSSESPPPGRRWVPPSQKALKGHPGLAYVVVDEIESDFIGLSISPWPTLDEWGRLRFGLGRARSIGTGRTELQRFLGRHRLPQGSADRPIRIGDVFAISLKEPVRANRIVEPAAWIRPPVYDISADARDAAKASFYSAVAPTLDPKTRAGARILALAEDRKTKRAPGRRRPQAGRRG
jgi:hypothetical protein